MIVQDNVLHMCHRAIVEVENGVGPRETTMMCVRMVVAHVDGLAV